MCHFTAFFRLLQSIWYCLKNQGVVHGYIRIIKNVYTTSAAKIKLEKERKQVKIN